MDNYSSQYDMRHDHDDLQYQRDQDGFDERMPQCNCEFCRRERAIKNYERYPHHCPPGPPGPRGPKGDPGPRGEEGPQGPRGCKGKKGDTGPHGPIGPAGPKGDKGDRGERGPVGPKGDVGDQGPEGPKGDKGSRGERGLEGPKGDKGDRGERGPEGPKGDKGDQGIQGERGLVGPKGDKGDQGQRGLEGPKGDKGDQGERGLEGPKGDKGDQGERGLEGPKGDKGDQGERGLEGPRGPMGTTCAIIPFASGYPISVTSGMAGERSDVAVVGFGNVVRITAATTDPITLPASVTYAVANQLAFSMPEDGVITALSAYITVASGPTINSYFYAQLYYSSTPNNVFMPVGNVSYGRISFPLMPALAPEGTIRSDHITLSPPFPVTAGTRLMLVFFHQSPSTTSSPSVYFGGGAKIESLPPST